MKGVLQKQGQVAGSDLGGLWTPFRWRNRYFEERDDKLYYYKQQGDAEPQGFIDISAIVKVESHQQLLCVPNLKRRLGVLIRSGLANSSSADKIIPKSIAFDIITRNRTYHLRASSEVEQIAWINALNKRAKAKEVYVIDKDDWINQMRSARRSIVVTVVNNTKRRLVRRHYKLHGSGQIWKQFPPETIEPGAEVVFGNCSSTLISGARASVTYYPEGSTDPSSELWFRWENPYRKLIPSKQSLFDVPPSFGVVVEQDLSESHAVLIMNHDLFRIKYTITEGAGGTSSNANRAAIDAKGDTVDDDVSEEGSSSSNSPAVAPASAAVAAAPAAAGHEALTGSATLHHKTQYFTEEWITKLRQALRSTLITVENNTEYELKRFDWDLRRGIWRMIPPEKIAPHSRIQFGTESSGLGFDVGTWGRLIYTTAASEKEEGNVITLSWTNTFLFGVNHQINLTSTSSDQGETVADMEDTKQAAAEVTFRIYQSSAHAKAAEALLAAAMEASPKLPADAPRPASATHQKRAMRVIVQEDGLTTDFTSNFKRTREKYNSVRRNELDKVESRLEMVCFQALAYLKEHQDIASSFLNLFRDEPEIEFSVDMQDPDEAKACPISHQPFRAAKEKVNCWICGRVVHATVISYLPFPQRYQEEVNALKDKPKGVKVCQDCLESMKVAGKHSEWKSIRDRAAQNPIVAYERKLVRVREDAARAATEFGKLVATQSPEASTMALRVEILFKEIQETKEDIAKLQLWKGTETDSQFVENLLRSVDEFLESSWEEYTVQKKNLGKFVQQQHDNRM